MKKKPYLHLILAKKRNSNLLLHSICLRFNLTCQTFRVLASSPLSVELLNVFILRTAEATSPGFFSHAQNEIFDFLKHVSIMFRAMHRLT